MKHVVWFFLGVMIWGKCLYAQGPLYSANDSVVQYFVPFGYGSNLGYYPPHGTTDLLDIAAGKPAQGRPGVGVHSVRGILSDEHLGTFGLTVESWKYLYGSQLGITNNACIVGYPHWTRVASGTYCNDPLKSNYNEAGNMFQGMYLPIWDNNNGTPINENNAYAKYLWDVVSTYGQYVEYWTIWNEPDWDGGQFGWRDPSDPLGWWGRTNFHCDLLRFKGTLYDYVRLMRISWEVIKTLQPNDLVCIGGIGYPSFLDAILQLTDNPLNGSVTSAYPLKGGAYFDCVDYHAYPQYEQEVRWGSFLNRNSDAAASALVGKKDRLQAVLASHGYDGLTYPVKRWIITEHNVARLPFGTEIGGNQVQLNYIMKALALLPLRDVEQSYVFSIAEEAPIATASWSYQVMGLYPYIMNQTLPVPPTDAGIAHKTMGEQLYAYRADKIATAQLNLPAGVGGVAYTHILNGQPAFVLWAKTNGDLVESANATYTLPASFNLNQLVKREWNYSVSGLESLISSLNISLSTTPVLLFPQTTLPVESLSFSAYTVAPRQVIAEWHTQNEQQMRRYVLERAAKDGFFNPIAEIPSLGDGNHSYRLTDPMPLPGYNAYRLQMTDMQGYTSYAETVELWIEDQGLQLHAFPNPAQQNTRLQMLSPIAGSGLLRVMDSQGRLVLQQQISLREGFTQLDLPLLHLPAGMYMLELRQQAFKPALLRLAVH